MAERLDCDVLIVGAGPTGLMAANQLARFGVDFLVVDQKEGPTRESRAIAVTARSLEIYKQMGLSETVLKEAVKVTTFRLISKGIKKAKVQVGEMGKGLTEFSYLLAFEQSKNEELLCANLPHGGEEVLWQTTFTALEERERDVNVQLVRGDKKMLVNCKYLLACDGANSQVRQLLNFSFAGGTYENRFFVADATVRWDFGEEELIISPGRKNFCAFLPLFGNGNHRVIGTLPKDFADKEDVTFEEIEETVRQTLGHPVIFDQVNWFSVYKLHHRSVDHFRQGRVFLAGDSAHIHSPAGGQGMNTGLQDAYNIAWKLAMVLSGKANDHLLETYNEERLPFAKWLLRFTDRGFRVMTSDNALVRWLRLNILMNIAGFIATNKRLQTRAFRIVSQLWYNYGGMSLSESKVGRRLGFTAGDRLPFFPDDPDFQNRFNGPCFHLLYIGENGLDPSLRRNFERMFPFPTSIVEEKLTQRWQKLGIRKELFVLVRPDNYVGYVSDTLDPQHFSAYVSKFIP